MAILLYQLITTGTHSLHFFFEDNTGVFRIQSSIEFGALSANTVNSIKLLNIFAESSIKDAYQGSEYVSEYVQDIFHWNEQIFFA